jgi:hypothetical protein
VAARVPVLTSLPHGWHPGCDAARTWLNKLKKTVEVGQKEQSSDRDSWHPLSRFLGDPVNQTTRSHCTNR